MLVQHELLWVFLSILQNTLDTRILLCLKTLLFANTRWFLLKKISDLMQLFCLSHLSCLFLLDLHEDIFAGPFLCLTVACN